MSNDLEEFLRRAAERRRAKQEKKPPPARPSSPPQYTDARSERVVREEVIEDDELPVATLVQDLTPHSLAAPGERSLSTHPMEGTANVRLDGLRPDVAAASTPVLPHTRRDVEQPSPGDLVKLLRSPGGLRQAILLREVFDRPQHRW